MKKGERKDVFIKAPPMVGKYVTRLYTEEELGGLKLPAGVVAVTNDELKKFGQDFENLKMATKNFAHIAMVLIGMFSEDERNEILITKEMIHRYDTAQLQIQEDAMGNVIAKVVFRAPSLIVSEGR